MLVATVVEPRRSIVSVPVDGGDAGTLRELGDATTSDLDPSLSPDGRRIVFSSARSGNRNLWIAAADGTHPQPLTSGSAIDDRPAFSRDGKSIAFVSDRGGARGVWTVSADGGSVRLVGKAQVLDTISWSPDGSEIVFGTVGDQPGLSAIRPMEQRGASSRRRRRSVPRVRPGRRAARSHTSRPFRPRMADSRRRAWLTLLRANWHRQRPSTCRRWATARSRGTEAAGASPSTAIRAPSRA